MNRNAIELLQEFVVIQMNHWVLFTLFLMPMAQLQYMGLSGNPDFGFWAVMGYFPLCFYLLRKHLRNLGFMVLGHLAAVFVLIGLTQAFIQNGRFVYLLFGIGYGVYSLHIRLSRDDMQDVGIFMPLAVGIFVLSSFFTRYLGYHSWDSYYIFALIFVLGLYFFQSYLDNYISFLLLNESSAGHIPEREMFASGSVLVLLFSAGSMILLFLLSNLGWLQGILHLLRTISLEVLGFLIYLISFMMKDDLVSLFMQQNPEIEDLQRQLETSEPFLLWDILFNIIAAVLFCFLLYKVFAAIKGFVLFVKSKSYQKDDNNVRKIGHVSDFREKCATKGSEKGLNLKKLSFWQAFQPRERIRSLYKKHILQAKPADGSDNSAWGLFTAREWGVILEEPDMPDIYEKARYSEEICTAEDVKRMKAALRRKMR